jgi:hypothetical protein
MTSALTVYRQSILKEADCLFRVRAVWKDGAEDSSDFALVGQAFHYIKYLYVTKLTEQKTPQDENLARLAFAEGIAGHQTPMRLIPELREMWGRHVEVFALDLDRVVAAEHRIVLGQLSGTLDLLYAHPGELEIIDDKTFWRTLTETEARASFQARLYTWLARHHFPGFQTYRFTFSFVRFNKTTSVVFTQADLDQVELEAQAAVARIEYAESTGQWPAQVGPTCEYCSLRCPVADQEATLPIRLAHADAQKAAVWLIPIEKKIKAIRKAFKGYCVTNGPVSVGKDTVWGNWPVTERKYPLDLVLKVLAQRNIMGAFENEGLTVSHSALAKLMKQFPALVEDLKEFVQEKTTYRFGLKKVEDVEARPFDGDEAE